MQTCYLDFEHRAIADLVPVEDGWLLTRINVPKKHRGRKVGSKMLDMICAQADMEGVDLILAPMSSDGLSKDQLISWYRRRGFVQRPDGHLRRAHSRAGE